ncbi:LOW QUALITY PROTEIN: WD repeat-containing protein 64 [Porphyrio hochstetteri]
MSETEGCHEESGSALQVPGFKNALKQFQELVEKTVTQKTRGGLHSEGDDEIDYDKFYKTTQTLFGTEVKDYNVKAFFRKISNKLDTRTEWHETCIALSLPVIKRQDVIRDIVSVPHLDFTVTCSQEGVLTIFRKQVSIAPAVGGGEAAELGGGGGHDKLLGLWHPAINSRPTGQLSGHQHSVVEIVTNKDQHVISLSSAKIFRVWDIQTLSVLQVFHVSQGSPQEMETFAMVFGNTHGTLITGVTAVDAMFDHLCSKAEDATRYNNIQMDVPFSKAVAGHSPILASAHENGCICLWSIQGNLVKELLPFSKYPSVPLTALRTDISTKMLLGGSKEGHVMCWSIDSFLEDPNSKNQIKEELCWRAHSNEVVEEEKNVVVTASIDGSARLWQPTSRYYLGCFGQPRKFDLSAMSQSVLPCDVNNFPTIIKEESKSMEEKKKSEYPLMRDRDKWRSLTRLSSVVKKPKHVDTIQDLKFFKALSSLKHYRASQKTQEYTVKIDGTYAILLTMIVPWKSMFCFLPEEDNTM